MAQRDRDGSPRLPSEPIDRIVAPLARFLHVEAAGGIVLLAAAVAAVVIANTPYGPAFLALFKTHVVFGIGSFVMDHSLKHWISDGLMGIFFFVMGLEVKREMVLGELRDLRSAALPIAAALGGMIVPAALYLLMLGDHPAARGWGIPMATDIAFVVGCMAVLGSRVPTGLRVMLLSLAIADDIGAILVIAIGYTDSIQLGWLAAGALGIGLVRLVALLGVRSIGVYVAIGGLVWLAFHESGVHATIAGVILGLLTPTDQWVGDNFLSEMVDRASALLGGGDVGTHERHAVLGRVATAAKEAVSPMVRLEVGLHPWVSFAIVPLFALANAGVVIAPAAFADPVASAVAVGLLIGKPVGIVGFSMAAVGLGIARKPEGVSWDMILAGGLLAGIGFTMSLFIAGLALEGAALDASKMGILGASLVAGVLGTGLLAWRTAKPARAGG